MPQLLSQSLVEREESRLGTTVIHITGLRSKGSQTSNVDDMPVVSSYHSREEVLYKQYRRDHIYVEDFADLGLGQSEDRHGVADPGVVNENSWVAMFRDNLLATLEISAGSERSAEEKDTFGARICQSRLLRSHAVDLRS
jgi:hypothetical protein